MLNLFAAHGIDLSDLLGTINTGQGPVVEREGPRAVSLQALALATGLWPEHLTLTADLADGANLMPDMCCRKAVLTLKPAQGPGFIREWIAMTPATPGCSLVIVWSDAPPQRLGRVDRVYVDTGLGL